MSQAELPEYFTVYDRLPYLGICPLSWTSTDVFAWPDMESFESKSVSILLHLVVSKQDNFGS
jgi:hypothetical protein